VRTSCLFSPLNVSSGFAGAVEKDLAPRGLAAQFSLNCILGWLLAGITVDFPPVRLVVERSGHSVIPKALAL
jgi:hypothetical protein